MGFTEIKEMGREERMKERDRHREREQKAASSERMAERKREGSGHSLSLKGTLHLCTD